MTGTVSMTNAGRIASSVVAARPSTVVDALACTPKAHAYEYPTMHGQEWPLGFGFSRQDKQVLREVAVT